MDYQSHSPWEHAQMFAYNSMTAPQVDQQEASFSPDGPLHWLDNLDPAPRGRSHPDSHQEWAHTPEPSKAFSNMQNHQQQYSYQEAHQNTYPPPQVLTPNLPYNPSVSFNSTQWAPSPSVVSHDSSALSPQSDRDFRQDLSIAALPLSRSQSGFSTLSHEADYFTSGGQQFQQQTIANLSMIHHHQADEALSFREDDEMAVDTDSGELESITVTRPTNPQYLHPYRSPAPPSIHRHVSPAPSSYSSHNPPAPRLTPNHAVVEVDDAELDAEFDLDSQPAADDTDTDGTYTPHPRRPTRPTRGRNRGRRVQPATPLHPSTTTRVTKRGPKASTSSAGRATTSNPTFPCTFAWAGCTSAFASKNEWKRHVTSKHTCFNYWECDVGACSAPGQSGKFNRKDLFAQHLRRMHSPGASALSGPGKEEWELKLAAMQDGGKRTGRAIIKKVACPVPGCGHVWEGTRAWDERMEHVAKHWEAVARGEDGSGWCESTGGVLEWAEQEGAVKRQGGGWVLGGPVGEADAVGEEE